MQVTPKAPIDKCPYCGSDWGYYTKDYICGSTWYRCNYDGSEADNGDMYDILTHRAGKVAYCQNCNHRLFKISDLKEATNE